MSVERKRQKSATLYDNFRSEMNSKYYDYSQFMNWGYWTPETKTQKEACEELVERLLDVFPERKGTIMDVACGWGATTRHLQKYYEPANITAVNYSEKQIAAGRENAPGSNFVFMDGARLDFPAASVDNIICVEGPGAFDTREDFFYNAFRVLKPGGRLSFSDVLVPHWFSPHNYVKGPNEIRDQLVRVGYEDVKVTDVTEECWRGFLEHVRVWPEIARDKGQLSFTQYIYAKIGGFCLRHSWTFGVEYYILASGRKPPA